MVHHGNLHSRAGNPTAAGSIDEGQVEDLLAQQRQDA
jgi:hypothetical protein